MNNPIWNSWVQKEFIYSMRSKGKLPEPEIEASTRLKEHTVHSLERLFPHRYEDKYATEREAKIGETIRKERATKDQRKTDRRDRHKEMRSTIERLENAYLSEVNERRKMEAEIEALKRAAGLTAAAVTDAISAADEPKLK